MQQIEAASGGKGLLGSLDDGRVIFDTSPRERGVKLDPVCGKAVDPDSGLATLHKGLEYRFCSEACRAKFFAAPERYVGEP
jgi:YHS domain-containing protein